jgi:hypothetical protein
MRGRPERKKLKRHFFYESKRTFPCKMVQVLKHLEMNGKTLTISDVMKDFISKFKKVSILFPKHEKQLFSALTF